MFETRLVKGGARHQPFPEFTRKVARDLVGRAGFEESKGPPFCFAFEHFGIWGRAVSDESDAGRVTRCGVLSLPFFSWRYVVTIALAASACTANTLRLFFVAFDFANCTAINRQGYAVRIMIAPVAYSYGQCQRQKTVPVLVELGPYARFEMGLR